MHTRYFTYISCNGLATNPLAILNTRFDATSDLGNLYTVRFLVDRTGTRSNMHRVRHESGYSEYTSDQIHVRLVYLLMLGVLACSKIAEHDEEPQPCIRCTLLADRAYG
jgi:hypothetical protein